MDLLVNNAGITRDGVFLRMSNDDFDDVVGTNLRGTFLVCRAFARPMMKAQWGRIIFMGSVVGETGNGGQSAYAATKASLSGMAKSLARELASRNITANVIAPGYIETDMTRALPEDAREALTTAIPLGRVGQPDDIAEAVLFLASERARYITGQVLNVNGGMYM